MSRSHCTDGEGDGERDRDWDWNQERWVSILRYVLYTLHRDKDRQGTIVFYCARPGPVQCV